MRVLVTGWAGFVGADVAVGLPACHPGSGRLGMDEGGLPKAGVAAGRRSALQIEQHKVKARGCNLRVRRSGIENRPLSRYVMGWTDPARVVLGEEEEFVLHVGLDLKSQAGDVCVIFDQGELVDHFTASADRDRAYGLTRRVAVYDEPVRGVVESMNGARFVRDELVAHGWEVLVANAQKVKGLAPLACKTRIAPRVIYHLSFGPFHANTIRHPPAPTLLRKARRTERLPETVPVQLVRQISRK